MSEKPKEITESLIQAWADFCGIDRSDERAQFPNHPGCWPDDFRFFEAGWNAASVIRDFQIAEKEIPAPMLDAATSAILQAQAYGTGEDEPTYTRENFQRFGMLAAWNNAEREARIALEAARVPEMLADRERIGLALFQNGYDAGYTTDGAVEAIEAMATRIAELEVTNHQARRLLSTRVSAHRLDDAIARIAELEATIETLSAEAEENLEKLGC